MLKLNKKLKFLNHRTDFFNRYDKTHNSEDATNSSWTLAKELCSYYNFITVNNFISERMKNQIYNWEILFLTAPPLYVYKKCIDIFILGFFVLEYCKESVIIGKYVPLGHHVCTLAHTHAHICTHAIILTTYLSNLSNKCCLNSEFYLSRSKIECFGKLRIRQPHLLLNVRWE